MPSKAKTRVPSAREIVIKGFHDGESNADISRRVVRAHPASPLVTPATINYLRNEIRKSDKSVKSDRTIRRGK